MAFPVVPDVPGVPALPGPTLEVSLVLLTADTLTIPSSSPAAPWGLFKDGLPVITAESVVSFLFKKDTAISDYPVEQGQFQSYNKVAVPFDVKLRFSAGGSDADRQALLDSIEAASQTLDLFDAVTPEAVYTNVNVIHYDYRRSSREGAGLIIVDVWCQQIISNATSTFTNTVQPSGASPTSSGAVQTTAATTAQKVPVNNTTSVVAGGAQWNNPGSGASGSW